MEGGPSYGLTLILVRSCASFLLFYRRRVASGPLKAAPLRVRRICSRRAKSVCFLLERRTLDIFCIGGRFNFFFGSRTSLLGFMLLLKDNVCLNNFLTQWLVSHYVLCPPFL